MERWGQEDTGERGVGDEVKEGEGALETEAGGKAALGREHQDKRLEEGERGQGEFKDMRGVRGHLDAAKAEEQGEVVGWKRGVFSWSTLPERPKLRTTG